MRFAIAALAFALLASPAQAQVMAVPWAEQQPTEADYRSTYPRAAMAADLEGYVRLLCTVLADRTLDCAVSSETPSGAGFGEAALALARKYVVSADDPRVAIGNHVIVPIRYVLH